MNMFSTAAARRFSAMIRVLMLLMMFVPFANAAESRQIWQSRDQFVALERQDSPHREPQQPNDHPCYILSDRLTAMLASIEISPASSGTPGQLMTTQSLELLVPHLVQGLRQATSGEDVTFAIIGLHKSALGFASRSKVTTGRIFYQGRQLNIIFGQVQKDVNEREDRRLAPFTPGSRELLAAGEWNLLAQPGQNGYKQVRKDWLAFSDDWQATVVQPPAAKRDTPSPPQVPTAQNSGIRTPAERLTTLKELMDKELITEDEYRVKRQEILMEL
jgi:hypothetical protein